MAEELQAFLNRIQQQGIQSGEEEARNIVEQARQEAELILRRARAESQEILRQAEKEAEKLVVNGKESLRLAARDTLLSLRHELQDRMQALFRQFAGDALSPAEIASIIADIIHKYHAAGNENLQIEALLDPDRCQALESALLAHLGEKMKTARISPVPGISGGFQLRIEGEDIIYDFTDEALAEALKTFLNPKLTALLKV